MSDEKLEPPDQNLLRLFEAEKNVPNQNAAGAEAWAGFERALALRAPIPVTPEVGGPGGAIGNATEGGGSLSQVGELATATTSISPSASSVAVGALAGKSATAGGFGLAAKLAVATTAGLITGAGAGTVVTRQYYPKEVVVEKVVYRSAQKEPSDETPSEPEAPANENAESNSATSLRRRPERVSDDALSKKKILGSATTLAYERRLIETARSAIARANYPAAVAATKRHAREFKKGVLAEERDALQVIAVARLGDEERAATLGARFLKRYRQSVFRPAVEKALRKEDRAEN